MRHLAATELRMLVVLPLVLVRALRATPPNEFRYDRRKNFGLLAIVFAFVGVLEGGVVALLLMGRISWLAWLDLIATSYAVLWLIGLALGPRVYPHRLVGTDLQIRLGFLYRATTPLATVLSAEEAAVFKGWRSECAIDGTSAYFRADGYTDAVLVLSSPCQVELPVRGRALVDTLHLAVDDVADFLLVLSKRPGQPSRGTSPAT